MATLAELARMHTRLDGPELGHLQRLMGSWGMLADLCFSDLLLFVPVTGGEGSRFVLLDDTGRVEYASPNAVNALHRMGVYSNAEGLLLGDLGIDDAAVRLAFATRVPATEEVERLPEVIVLVRCIPLLDSGRVNGGL